MISFDNCTINFGSNSLFQRSPSGISYRIPKAMIETFNSMLYKIGQEAAKVAEALTPFSYFKNAWSASYTKGGRYDLVESITVFNKKARGYMTYKSKYSNSGKNYRFGVSRAISMLETGRAGGYTIEPKGADTEALTLPPHYAITRKNGKSNLSKDGKTAFFRSVLGGSLDPTLVLTQTVNFMKDSVEGSYSAVGAVNYSKFGTAKSGKTTKSKPRNFRSGR